MNNDLKNTLRDLNTILKRLDELQEETKNSIKKKLDSTPDMKGVKRISDNVVIVSASALNSKDFTAEYYMSNIQVKYIKEQLSKISDIRKVLNKINEFIENEKVQVNSNFKINLNPEVLNCLKEIQSDFNYLE